MGRDLKIEHIPLGEEDNYYYYDSHPTEEDLMGDTVIHCRLISYLEALLIYLFRGLRCAIYRNLNVYQTPDSGENPVTPDLMVIKGVELELLRSWKMLKTKQAPHVVFEVASEETWENDVQNKPGKYGRMGVLEYFFYDPDKKAERRHGGRRLIGWKRNAETEQTGKMEEVVANNQGWLWSEQLESWLVPDGEYLRLYDRLLQCRLTGEEVFEQRAEALAQKLRLLGIDPDSL